MRILVPADTLVYLETNDLAAALQPIVNNKKFEQVAKSKPDFSPLKGLQLAVAITGFETTEEKLTDEHSIGRVQPHFVAIAETHAWNYQAVGFAEQKLGGFVENIYNSEPKLERTDKDGGKYFIWTAVDGRKAYALVIDSLIYFGNDESSIDKCLAVKRGEADSIEKTGKVASSEPKTLASGYVSADGVAQIANIIGLKFAPQVSDEPEVQSAAAGLLPQLIRNSISDIMWTSNGDEKGVADEYVITLPPNTAKIFVETMAPSDKADSAIQEFLPSGIPSVTLYNLTDPLVAWRSVLLTAQANSNPLAGKLIIGFSNIFFEPYGVDNPELFLRSVGPNILTARFDDENEPSVVIATVKDKENVEKSLSHEFTASKEPEAGSEVLLSQNDDLKAAFFDDKVVIGDSESVDKFLANIRSAAHRDPQENLILEKDSTSITRSRDSTFATKLADLLSSEVVGKNGTIENSTTETRFTKTGIVRRTVSDFGLIGTIISQLAGEQ